jgi:HEAT repeat protein
MKLVVAIILAMLTAPSAAVAQEARITNGHLVSHPVVTSLADTVRQLSESSMDPVWIAYAMSVADSRSQMCCRSDDACCGGCRLEPGGGSAFFGQFGADRPTPLEPPDLFFVFYRVEGRRIERIRTFSENCMLDAGGRTVHWLTGVKAAESVALLASLASAEPEDDRVVKGAVSAIAQHRDQAGVTALLRLARDATRSNIRSDALFWVAQRAGTKAAPAITEAIERDPETEVKKRAVFALTQLPKDEAVPKLIEVARTNRNPVVRKQAMFWLGQSNDPRALRFFEEVLK